jgi:hypothetical protein
MDIKKMSIKYSYIVDSIKFINDNEQRIKNMLLDYECHIKSDKHPSGVDVKILTFTKSNVKICFSPLRIDFEYGFTSALDEDVNSYDAASKFFHLFGEIFDEYKAERLAIYLTSFIDNTNDETVNHLSMVFNTSNIFGDCGDFHLRINNVKNYNEKLNSALSLEKGKLTNNSTNQSKDVVVCKIDVNTLSENRLLRFSPYNFMDDFSDLYEEYSDKKQILMNL